MKSRKIGQLQRGR